MMIELKGLNDLAERLKRRANALNMCKMFKEDYIFYLRCYRVLNKNNAHKKLIKKVESELNYSKSQYEYYSSLL